MSTSNEKHSQCFDLSSPVMDDVSPYDHSYPVVRLTNAIKQRFSDAQKAASEIYQAVVQSAPIIAQTEKAFRKGFRYVVDASDRTLAELESGAMKLSVENGKTYAQLRKNGRYGEKLPIKREDFAQGFDPVQMATSMQLMALQAQIQDVSEQLRVIDRSVREVIDGQHNDRVGLYFSGMALLMESRGMTNDSLRTALVVQALRSLSEASFQLSLSMQSDIDYLANGGFKSEKGKRKAAIDDRMQRINQSFLYIHQAMMLKAAVYCEQGENQAMAAALSEYSHFIEGTIARNANLLAQCDVHDSGANAGIWQKRAALKLDVSTISNVLSDQEQAIYLYSVEEDA